MNAEEKPLNVYDSPYYYDVAFSFRNINQEVDFFEQCMQKFSKIKVKKLLEIGCGPSPYMLELAKRGYAFTGLDISKAMLKYSLEKARKAGAKISTIHADMRKFKAKEKFDLAFCMLGSVKSESNSDVLSHLNSVAACLKRGSLYLIDASIQFDWSSMGSQSWTVLKDDLTVNVTWMAVPANYVEQKITDKLIVEVIKDGKTKIFRTENVDKIVFPQEFLELVKKNGKFEFVGWFNNFNLAEPLETTKRFNRPMTILRKK